jgi:mannose-1-phosphate guanylyltransferase
MVADETLYAMSGDTYWIDTGTPTMYLKAQMDLLRGFRGERAQGIHPDAEIAADATVMRSVIGKGAVIESGASVVGSVVMPGAVIGRSATVERAIIGPRATIGIEARVDDVAVIGDDAVVGRGIRVSGGTVGVGEILAFPEAGED